MSLAPRAVLVHRRTEYAELLAAHGTRGQAEFFLRTRGQTLEPLVEVHERVTQAFREVSAQVPNDWRRAVVEREELPGFLFEPDDVVVVVGQDGLVANVAKYLTAEQPLLGVNPDPSSIAGVLVPWGVRAVRDLLADLGTGRAPVQARTLVQARTDDGDSLFALNEVFVGHESHQSARYRLSVPDGQGGKQDETHSSSGILVGTGTGATGWLASVNRTRREPTPLPGPCDPTLAWFVREAWPSPNTGVTLDAGLVAAGDSLLVTAGARLVCFGDGLESDALALGYGERLTVRVADRRLHTVG